MSSVVTGRLALDITIGADLLPELDHRPTAADGTATLLERDVSSLMEELGLPGGPSVSLSLVDDARATARLRLAAHQSRFPTAVRQAAQHLHDVEPSPEDWIEGAPALTADILRAMCTEFLRRHAHLLVGDEQVDLYARALGSSVDSSVLRPERLAPIMKTVASLGISLDDVATVRRVLAQTAEGPALDAAEALVAELAAPLVDIRLAPDLLRRVLEVRTDGTPFAALREALFAELGVELPSLHLAEDPALAPATFSVKVNALDHLAWRALPDGHLMVNCPAERLRDAGVPAAPWLNPQGLEPFAVVPETAEPEVERLGWKTWPQLDHVALCSLETLRTRAPALLTRPMLDRRLDLLRVINPRLMEAFDQLESRSSVLNVFRALVAEQLSIEDLAPMLELWLELTVRGNRSGQRDSLIAGLREGLARQIAVRCGLGLRTSTLVVWLLDPQLESAIRDAVQRFGHPYLPCTELGERLADAARSELSFLSPSMSRPAILTSVDIRPAVRHLIAYEFPRLAVVSYNELPPTLNVQPVARIGTGLDDRRE